MITVIVHGHLLDGKIPNETTYTGNLKALVEKFPKLENFLDDAMYPDLLFDPDGDIEVLREDSLVTPYVLYLRDSDYPAGYAQ